MNNDKGYKTDHSACILEEKRLHVYRWMLKKILNDRLRSEFLCHLLEEYNSKHKTNYMLEQFPELVMQRQSDISWWNGMEDKTRYTYIDPSGDTPNMETRRILRSYILSDAIEFLSV